MQRFDKVEVAKHRPKQTVHLKMEGFHVEILKSKSLSLMSDSKTSDLLKKWSLDKINISAWAFNEAYNPNAGKKLCEAIMEKCKSNDIFLGPIEARIELEAVPVTITGKDFLERLLDPDHNVVHRSGNIKGCFEEFFDEFIVADNLHQVLLNHESPLYGVFSEQERCELLFRILKHLALGGGEWCQYEDAIQPYIDMALKIYKYIVSVQKDPVTSQVQIRSKCFLIKTPDCNQRHFIYLLIDPSLREAILFAHTT